MRKANAISEVVGPTNRLNDFLSSDAIRAMVAHPAPLDLRQIMDDGDILLVNLSEGDAISEADAALLGTLLLGYFFLLARKRTHYKPFFIYADECHRFLSGDVPKILAQSRKYGVGAVLAHQFLWQLREAGGDMMYEALRNSTEVKAVFRVKSQQEAEELAHSVMPINLEMPVEALIRPTAVAQEVMLFKGSGSSKSEIIAIAEAVAKGLADTVGESAGSAFGNFSGEGLTQMIPGDPSQTGGWLSVPLALSHSLSASAGMSEMTSSASMRALTPTMARTISNSLGRGASLTESVREGLRTVYQEMVSAVHSKDNALYMAGQVIRTLPVGTAFVAVRDRATRVNVLSPRTA
jgi:hypothetical protein